jgi:hypothetical protein
MLTWWPSCSSKQQIQYIAYVSRQFIWGIHKQRVYEALGLKVAKLISHEQNIAQTGGGTRLPGITTVNFLCHSHRLHKKLKKICTVSVQRLFTSQIFLLPGFFIDYYGAPSSVLCVLCVCKCVLYYCHRVSTQLQLNNNNNNKTENIYILVLNVKILNLIILCFVLAVIVEGCE